MSMYTYACMKPKSGPKPPLGFRVLPSLGNQSPSRKGDKMQCRQLVKERRKERERERERERNVILIEGRNKKLLFFIIFELQ